MEANYTANMYLTPNDLNQVEDKIEELTNKVQEKIYNNVSSPLRPIQIGDDLSNKTLYLSFPRNVYEEIEKNEFGVRVKVLETTNPKFYIETIRYDVGQYKWDNINAMIPDINNPEGYILGELLYRFDTEFYNDPDKNITKVILHDGIGSITSMDEDICKYIQIYDDESIIPNYVKKTWVMDEIPYMQYINNIEQGIKNLGKYFTKPLGWINSKSWLGIIDARQNSYIYGPDIIYYDNLYGTGTNIDSFSYQDINRWIHNLNLIEQEDMENVTIWNTDKTEYEWEGHTEKIDYKVLYDNSDIQYGGSDIYYEYVD